MNMKKTIAIMMAMGMLPMTVPAMAETAPTAEATVQAVATEAPVAEVAPTEAAAAEAVVTEAPAVVAETTGAQAAEATPTEAPAAESETTAEAPAEAAEAEVIDPYLQKLDASYTLALNAITSEDYDTAKEYLNVCFAYCDPQSNPVMYADLLLKRACIDVIEEKNDMAILSLDAALKLQPDLADAWLVRTQVYAGQGDVDEAIASLEKYIELTKDTSLYETVAQLQEAKGDLDAAQAAYDKYVEGVDGEVPEAGFQSGLYKMQAGKFDEAIAAFEAYAQDETYAAGAAYNIGICRMNQDDLTGAIESFNTCVDKGGDFDGLYYNRGICKMMTEQWNSAAGDFTTSIDKESFVDDARYNLGICQMQQAQYTFAITTFTTLIGDGEAAATTGTEAQQTEAGNAVNDGAYYYRAVCRAANNDLDGAIADYTICIDHGYELSQSYYQRAQVYGAKGDAANQSADLQNSLKYAE